MIFSYIYTLYFNVNISFILGYISSMIIAYILNSFLVFKDNLGFTKFIKFCISYIPNFIIQNIFIFILYNIYGLNKLIVFALASIIGVPVTFLIMKLFTFKK